MNLYFKQRGIGSLGWLVILSIVGFVLLCLFRLGPAYLDNRYIVSALETLAKNPDIHDMDKNAINKELDNFLLINGVRGAEGKSFTVVRKKDRTLINSVYEVRVHLVANIDVVMTFKSQLDSTNPKECCEYLIPDEK